MKYKRTATEDWEAERYAMSHLHDMRPIPEIHWGRYMFIALIGTLASTITILAFYAG